MARTSKKEEQIFSESVWKAGIYARLSVDGGDRKNESIAAQIEISKKYIEKTESIELIDCYTDLGKTGTNFKRPGFERMMADVHQKKINCVVVKDFSRFGRNYIETGNYIEKIFPFLNVRFIAVTDGYDSGRITGDNLQLSMNLKNIINELYAKDIAQRVKAAKKIQKEMGSYTGGAPPYGYYVKKVGNKNVLFPDAVTKRIVVKIFEMYAEGSTRRKIVEELYKEKVRRPSVYYATKEAYCLEGEIPQPWSYDTIKNILMNPVYIGTLFPARICKKECHGLKRREVDEENDVSVVEHTHEPLISEEIFYKVAERFERQRKYANGNGFSKKIPQKEDIFKGSVYCGLCGHRMLRASSVKTLANGNHVRRYYYVCPNKDKIDNIKCKCSGLSLKKIESLIKAVLEKEFAFSEIDKKNYYRENAREAEKKKGMVCEKIYESAQRRNELTQTASQLYVRYREGGLSRETFLEEKTKIAEKLENLKKQETNLALQEKKIDNETDEKNRFIRTLLKWKADDKLDRELAECLVKEIRVYLKHRVEIVFNYRRNDLLDGRESM